MINFSTIIIIVLSLLLIHALFGEFFSEFFTLTPIKSSVDGNIYKVDARYDDKEIAADYIGKMNVFSINLLKKMKEVYLSEDGLTNETPEYMKGRDAINILLKRFNSDSFKENDSTDPNKTSYTTDKGRIIALCLREKNSGKNKLHDIELIKFVLLHELAHCITVSYDHNLDFWVNFRFLLEFCVRYNLYKSIDYVKNKTVYCGLEVEYSPLSDPNIPSYFV